MTRKCIVPFCKSTHKTENSRFFRFPSLKSRLPKQLAEKRVKCWLSALGFRAQYNVENKYICNLHFISGAAARSTEFSDVDWVPSLHIPERASVSNPVQRNRQISNAATLRGGAMKESYGSGTSSFVRPGGSVPSAGNDATVDADLADQRNSQLQFSYNSRCKHIAYQAFPYKSDRIEKWIHSCGICSVHFDDRDFNERNAQRRQLNMDAIPSTGGHLVMDNDVDRDYTATVDGEISERISLRENVRCEYSSSDNEDTVTNEDSNDVCEYEQTRNDTVEDKMCKICHSLLLPDAKNLLQYAAIDKTYKDVVQETLNIQVHTDDAETMRICEKCSNFIENLHSFVSLCREGLSRTIDKTPHSITSEFQTSDEEECYDYDTVSLEELIPDQQDNNSQVIPEIATAHNKLHFMQTPPDTMGPLSPLDTDSEEASSSKNMDQNEALTCKVCGKVYCNKLQLQEHMNLHTKKIKYPCQHCEKVFYARRVQIDHEQSHLDKLNPTDHLCDECGFVYSSKKQLDVHLQLKHSAHKTALQYSST